MYCKAKFLKELSCEQFTFQKGKKYKCLEETSVPELQNFILVRQPNSPKGKDWWCQIPKADIGSLLELHDQKTM
jgi:hypothetical protein